MVPTESARRKQSIAPVVRRAELYICIAKEHLKTFSMRCDASDAATGAPGRQLPSCRSLPDHSERLRLRLTCQQYFCAGALQCESGAIPRRITTLVVVLFPMRDEQWTHDMCSSQLLIGSKSCI